MRRLSFLALFLVGIPFRAARPDIYVTSGTFFCGGLIYAGTCLAQGNMLTLTNGASTIFFTFTGLAGQATFDTNTGTPVVTPLGTIDEQTDATNPLFPLTSNLNEPIFRFLLTLTLDGISRSWFAGAYQTPDGQTLNLEWTNHYIAFGGPGTITPVFTQNVDPVFTAHSASVPLFADAVLVPEPSSLVLVATGLALFGLAGMARSRKQ